MDSTLPRADALAIRDGRIVFVGGVDGARARAGPSTTVLTLEGRMILPAFQDAHVHPVSGGLELDRCDLLDLRTRAAILDRIRACAAGSDSGWLVGSRWDLPVFPDANPRKEWLDSIVPDRPAYFPAADHHSAWVNSAALRLAGVTRATPDPPRGRIERDAGGEPSGTLRESAMQLVSSLIPPPSPDRRLDGLRQALALLNRHGVTALQEASADRPLLETYRDLERLGELTARVVVAMRADPRGGPAQVDTFVAWRAAFRSPRVHPEVVKFFLDGVIEARTAAMLQPYTDRPGWAGEPNWTAATLDSMVARLVAEGFSIHLHAIGDRAVRMALDAVEQAERGQDRGTRRHQIAHVQVVDPADAPRFGALGVIANFQPLWAYPDAYIRDLTWPALGPDRSQWIYPINAVLQAGGRIAFGSDWSVTSLVPLEGIQVAVTRRDPADSLGLQLLPEQAIALEAALRAYTLGAAYANGLDSLTGSLRVGKAADLVVLEADLQELPPHRIAGVRVLLTLLDGKPVHGSLDSLSGR
ncbi:MAG TPA: amidohydrolase [Gemmatimonadales bacterium]